VYLADSLNLELLAFAHDSTGPRLGSVTVSDSVTIRAIFDTPLDPRVPVTTSQFTVTGPDSVRIAVASVKYAREETTLAAPVLPPISQSAIPVPQRRPAAAPVVLPKPTRPLLARDVLIVLARPLRAGATYRLNAIDATGPTGRKLSSDRSFTVPKPAAQPAPQPAAPAASRRVPRPAQQQSGGHAR
jgi:hypothetical protein